MKIEINNLTFGYDGSFDNVFEDLSVSIDTQWKLGLVGRNGRGKTTLLRLLCGDYEYSGEICSPMGFDYFPYNMDMNLSAIDAVITARPELEIWRFEREAGLLGLDSSTLERTFSTLSGGEQTKVLLAALFSEENKFLLIDEPTNHLDMEARTTVSEYLSRKNGYILVSHDRSFLDGCVDHILAINRAGIDLQRGNFSSWWDNKSQRDAFEAAENIKLKREISRLESSANEAGRRASLAENAKHKKGNQNYRGPFIERGHMGALAAKAASRAKNVERRMLKAVEEKSELLKNIDENEPLEIHPLTPPQRILVSAKDLSFAYPNSTELFTNLSFNITRGERIALRGRNGCGKSSLLKLITGELSGYTGELRKSGGLKISYASQDSNGIFGSIYEYAERNGINQVVFFVILRKLGFERSQFEKDISAYSAGQKKKLLLAKSLCEEAHLYIWDEPLNYIDLLNRIQIEELLKEYSPTMIFVEHDRAFCESIATKILTL